MIKFRYFLAIFSSLVLPLSSFSESELPNLPEPDFEFFDPNGRDSSASADRPVDLLTELEGLLENPSQRDAKSQLGLENVPTLIDPIPPKSQIQTLKKIPETEKVERREVVREIAKDLTKPVIKSSNKKGRVISSKAAPKKKNIVEQSNVRAVRFFPKDSRHWLEIEATLPITYTLQTKKDKKQLVFDFKGLSIPKQLRRAFNTSEFNSPVAMYTLGQVTKRKKQSTQLVVQMRQLVVPEVVQEGSTFRLQFPDKIEKGADRKLAAQLPENALSDSAFGGGKNYQGAPIEKLELKNTDIREALRLVLNSTGYNVIMSDDVKGQVGSLSLSDTPWDQAFHLLLKMKGLGYVLQGNILQIAPVDVLLKEREQVDKQEETDPLKTVMIPISYAKAATLAPRAQPFLSKRGKVDTDERTNTVLIRDVETVIKRIQKVISVLDTQPPAVSISAKFVEVSRGYTRTLGLGALTLAGQTSGINFGTPQAPNNAPGFGAVNGETFQGFINLSAPKFAALNATLSILETENSVKVLANPTITVQQGQKGNITQGSTTELPQAIIAGGVGALQGGLAQTANLTLDVTPIVANDGSISLDTNLLQELPRVVGGGGLGKDTRNIKTQIILKNGDTAVLGGVFTGREQMEEKGIPFLRNLPLLGYFFSSAIREENKVEVLIFITARILNPEAAFKQNL